MVVYARPLKQQASLRAHDLARKHEVVDVGHCFGKVRVLATMPQVTYIPRSSSGHQMQLIEVQRTIRPHQLKLNW